MEEFFNQYGYLALAAGTFLEGETVILVASVLIHSGFFKGPYIVIFAFFGSFVSDWIYYLIGRFNGRYFVDRRPNLKLRLEPVRKFFNRHRLQILFSYRFLYGFRILLPLLIGMSDIRPLQYLGYSTVAGLIWASTVTCVGYMAGMIFELTPGLVEQNILFIILGFASIGLLIGYLVRRFVARRMGVEDQVA